MRGIKPFKLGLISRPFQWGPSYQLGVSVLAYFPFDAPGALLTDIEMWDMLTKELPAGATVDVGIPKSRAELLVVGSAYAPRKRPVTTCPVRVRVGRMEKSLSVIGDREWQNDVPTQPKPFAEMPLGWDRAFGGAGFDRNPLGKGFAPIQIDGRESHPLPNIEIPGKLIRSKRERPDPAGLGPLDFTWPQRMSMAGTYDKRWLETRFPGFADDLDWRIWNLAAPDQQSETPFAGDEAIELENLHPEMPLVTARLPGLCARSFVQVRTHEGPRLGEVGLRLTTVWLFPHLLRGVCVFQGAYPITEDDGHDVEGLLIAAERLGEPRAPEHYADVMARRMKGDDPAELLRDEDLVPPGIAGFSPEVEKQTELLTIEGLRLKRKKAGATKDIEATRERIAALGLDPDKHGPRVPGPDPEMPTLAQIPEFEAKLRAEAEQMKAQAEEKRAVEFAKVEKLYLEAGLDFEEVKQEVVSPNTGPPAFNADDRRAYFRKLHDDLAAQGCVVPELETYATDPDLYAQWKEQEQQARMSYQLFAHQQKPAPPVADERASEIKREVLARHARREPFDRMDLTGADLRGVDLSGASLREAFLESVNLEEATLSGADLTGAVLAHATLSGAKLDGALLAGANLGKAKMIAVDAQRADLTKANLWGANLTGAVLRGAQLSGATFLEAIVDATDFSEIEAKNPIFYKQSFARASFARAKMPQAVFVESSLAGVDFSGATMSEGVLVDVDASGAKLAGATLTNLRVVQRCSLERADFSRAKLDKANLRGARLREADLSHALLDGADLSEADLSGAKLYRIVARGSLWIRTDLRGASLISADLKDSLLSKADIRGADFKGANLYGADFSLVRSDRATSVRDAIQLKVRTLPQRRPEP